MVYQCEEIKSREENCAECTHFLWESDKCKEDSFLTPIYRIMHPNHKPPHFERREGPLVMIIFKNTKYQLKESKV